MRLVVVKIFLSELSRHPSTAKDTFDILRIIADHELDHNRIMCSFDVKSLFTNIPVDFTVNLILDKVFTGKENKFPGLNGTELRKMLNWTCKNTVLQFNGKYYAQLDGVSMDGLTDCTSDGRCVSELVS